MNDKFRRIRDAQAVLCDGLLCVTKHTNDPSEFLKLWEDHGSPALREEVEDDIPYVTYTCEGNKWFLHVNLWARTLSELRSEMRMAA